MENPNFKQDPFFQQREFNFHFHDANLSKEISLDSVVKPHQSSFPKSHSFLLPGPRRICLHALQRWNLQRRNWYLPNVLLNTRNPFVLTNQLHSTPLPLALWFGNFCVLWVRRRCLTTGGFVWIRWWQARRRRTRARHARPDSTLQSQVGWVKSVVL